jgi:ribosomal protein S11
VSAEAATFDGDGVSEEVWLWPQETEAPVGSSSGGRHGFKNVAEQSYAMAAEISDRVREIAEARGLPESEVFERALERGLEDLWEELVLTQYLDGELDREEAIEHVGRTKVERAEREREVVEEDVDWGLNA